MGLDPYNLARFVAAQDAPTANYDQALKEMQAERKKTHWIWWIFPVIAGISRSPRGRKYSLTSLAEAEAYLSHPVLGPRLLASLAPLRNFYSKNIRAIMGSDADYTKFHSFLTLFDEAGSTPVFGELLVAFYEGTRHGPTRDLLRKWSDALVGGEEA